jgi:tripartite-type tricarboxylate transporter receptor subunit TctC
MKRLLSALAVACAIVALPAGAQPYPSKPIRFVVPFPPGGPLDIMGRGIAQKLQEAWGQPIVVDNRPGAGGGIGADIVAKSPGDGYTLLGAAPGAMTIGTAIWEKIPYDIFRDFVPISLLCDFPLLVLVSRSHPAGSIGELVAWLKANPGKANAASVGVGSAAHVCLADFQNRSGTKFQMVTYRGGAPAVQALAAGEADFSCLEGGQTLGLYRGGKIKIIGVASKTRWFGAPEVPTLAEGGVSGVELDFWHGLWAPKNTPKDVVAKLNDAVVKAFADDWVKSRFKEVGHSIPPPEMLTPKALHDFHKAEVEKWWPIMKAAGIKPKTN